MRGSVWCNLMLLHYYIVSSMAEEHSWSIHPIHVPGLVCDSLGFHYTVYPNGRRQNSVTLSALDKQGGAHVLSSRRDCGTWISRRPGGSVTLHAFYNGCYVYEENDENVMTILVKKDHNPGTWILPQTKVLRCPKLRDRSPEHCSVPNLDRIACASSSVSREDCNKRGCCFDDGDQMNPCYYGNKVTIQCTQDEQISVAISKAFTRPPLKLESVQVITGEEACTPVLRTDDFILFQYHLSTCGTTSKEIDGIVIYETVMVADIDVKIQNDTSVRPNLPIRLHIQCRLDSRELHAENTDVRILKPVSSVLPEPRALRMRFAKEKRAIEEVASNKTILASSQGVLYFPTAQETAASGNGSPELTGPLDKEWARVTLVVFVLAALVVGVYGSKRLCKMFNVKYHVQT